jgi:hypothetical protein
LQLKPGAYEIACVGFVLNSVSGDTDKVLSKSAFFNDAALAVKVLPGKVTTLEVFPAYKSEYKQGVWRSEVLYTPEITIKVLVDGVQTGQDTINRRTNTSVAWDDYHGPLKR